LCHGVLVCAVREREGRARVAEEGGDDHGTDNEKTVERMVGK
jgi:hypothetical protein